MTRFGLLLGSLLPSLALAQVSIDEPPISETRALKLDAPPVFELHPTDLDKLRAEDRLNDLDKSIRWRFGSNQAVDISPRSHGTWSTLADGSRVWRLQVVSEGAYHLNVLFDRYHLPPGARLWLRSDTTDHTIGAFTDANNHASGVLGTTLVKGEAMTIEYYEPAGAVFPGELHLSRITHGYRDAYGAAWRRLSADKALGDSESCNVDVACAEAQGHPDQVRSVGATVAFGDGFCSGALVNNTAEDATPYFLTADHCTTGDDVSGWVFWFNWQSADCDGTNPPLPDSVSGATMIATNAASDFSLLRIDEEIPLSYNVYLAGLDYRENVIPDGAFGIHHPRGDVKKFSEDFDPLVPGDYFSFSGNSHWIVEDWDEGTTEGGSSGSPLFNTDGNIVGQLHGGNAACGNDESDWYGATARSWEDGSTASSRLRDHLDPLGLDPGVIPGRSGVRNDFDVMVAEVTPRDGDLVCIGDLLATTTLRNNGIEQMTSISISYQLDGDESTTEWIGAVSTGDEDVVEIPFTGLGEGTHTLQITASGPNNQEDEQPANNVSTVSFTAVQGHTLPFSEGFEDAFPPQGWSLQDGNGQGTFETAFEEGFGGEGTSVFFNNFGIDETDEVSGDTLTSPHLDLSGTELATLAFDVSYARYIDGTEDGLRVLVSADCGDSFEVVYEKYGADLATAEDADYPFTPISSEWRTEYIDLSAYAGSTTVLVRLENLAGYSNNLYIDNVRVNTDPIPTPVPPPLPPPPEENSGACGCQTQGAGGWWLLLGGLGLLRRRRGSPAC